MALTEKGIHLIFPEADLLNSLVNLYFTQFNLYLPLLHRPTLEQGIRDGLHLRDSGFGCVVMLVCAIGGRYSDDPRVLLNDASGKPLIPLHSAGWKYWTQVQGYKNLLTLATPTLYDLQIICVSVTGAQYNLLRKLIIFPGASLLLHSYTAHLLLT